MPETFRLVTLALILVAVLWLPRALVWRVPGRRVWLVIGAIELQFIGAAIVLVDIRHGLLVWYRTPRVFVSAALAITYCWLARQDQRAGVHR